MRWLVVILVLFTATTSCLVRAGTPNACYARCDEYAGQNALACSELLKSNRSCQAFFDEKVRSCLKYCAEQPRSEAEPPKTLPGGCNLRVPEGDVRKVVRRCGTVACLAESGDIWLYATPILHASEAAIAPTHRRVLQVDYSVGPLPAPLEWLGI